MFLRLTFFFSFLALVILAAAFYVVRKQEAYARRLTEISANAPVIYEPSLPATDMPEKKNYRYELPAPLTDSSPVGTAEQTQTPADTPVQDTHLAPEDLVATRAACGMTDEVIARIRQEQASLYYYAQLTEAEQTLYAELYHIMTTLSQDVYISATDTASIEKVQGCVMNDHPEIFYISGYYTTRYTIGDRTVGFSFSGRTIYDAQEIASRNAQIDAYVRTCLAGAPQGDDYARVRYVYEYLIDRTSYLIDSPDNQNICSVMMYGASVCQGYAKAAQLLLNRLGVRTTLVVGTVHTAETSGSHAWNLVLADGNWYYLDVTWGDASFRSGESVSAGTNYDYLLTTGADISATHTPQVPVALPSCDHMEDNYYVREGAYFTEASLDLFSQLVERRRAEGAPSVTFKCANAEIYSQMVRTLIDESAVFDYIKKAPGETLSFSRSDETRSLTIWF